MQEITGKIRDFFNRYESRINRALEETLDSDATETAEAFSDFFIAANPNGVACGKNDEKFQLKILHGYEFYRSIGTESIWKSLISLQLSWMNFIGQTK